MYRSTGRVLAEKPSIGVEPTRLYDASRFKNHGVHTNITMVQLPKGLWVRSFGGDSYVKIASRFRGSDTKGTVLAWIKTPSSPNKAIWASADEATVVNYLQFGTVITSGALQVQSYDGSSYNDIRGSTNLFDDKWHLTALISDGSAWRINLDGIDESLSVASGTNNGSWFGDNATLNNFTIGVMERTSRVSYWTGDIVLVRVYNYALSPGRIKNIYEKQLRDWFI